MKEKRNIDAICFSSLQDTGQKKKNVSRILIDINRFKYQRAIFSTITITFYNIVNVKISISFTADTNVIILSR